MPRRSYGYGGDYRVNPRPIYGEDEPTWGESMSRGIGRFIEQRQKQKAEGEDWENKVRDASGEIIEPPSTMDRLRGIGNTIRKHLPGYDPLPEAEANMAKGRQPGDFVQSTPSRDGGSTWDEQPPRPTASPSFGHGHRGPVEDATPSTHWGLNDEIDRSIQQGPGGRSAILPTAMGRQQIATRAQIAAEARARAGKREEFGYEKDIEHRYKMEEIKATPRSVVDADEWDRRQRVIAGNAQTLKGTPSAPSGGSENADKKARAQVLRDIIVSSQAVIPKNPHDLRSSMKDSTQAKRIREAQADEAAARKELGTLEPGAAPKPEVPADTEGADREHNAGAPVDVMRKRASFVKADALKKFPKASPAAVAAYVRSVMKREGYNVQ